MGIFDKICCSCCSGSTVDHNDAPPAHLVRVQTVKPVPVEEEVKDEQEVEAVLEDVITEDVEDKVEEVEKHTPINKRPLKECKLKPHRRKIHLTGAAAAVPPCPTEECIGNIPHVGSSKVTLGDGAYLVYSLENGGSLNIVFSRTAPTDLRGVLAYIKPGTEFSPYYYTDHDGHKAAATNLESALQSEYASDRKVFYDAWSKFLKLAPPYNGEVYLLEGAGMSPPPRVQVLLYKEGAITCAESLKAIDLTNYTVVGILHHSLDYYKLADDSKDRMAFTQTCEEFGAALVI